MPPREMHSTKGNPLCPRPQDEMRESRTYFITPVSFMEEFTM